MMDWYYPGTGIAACVVTGSALHRVAVLHRKEGSRSRAIVYDSDSLRIFRVKAGSMKGVM
jgi:hypothetical protein